MTLPVTVVIPAYERAASIGRAIASALAQRPEPPAEVLVVDDGSTDDTAAAAEEAGARVVVHERNRGIAAARNTGVEAARHGWIAFLDSDDEWYPEMLATLWPLRDGHVLVGGAAVYVDAEPGRVRYRGIVSRRPATLDRPAKLAYPANLLPTSGTMARRDAVLAAGGFDAACKQCEDLDLWMRMLQHGTGVMSPVPVVRYHLHTGQTTHDRAVAAAMQLAVLRNRAGSPWRVEAWRGGAAWDELRRRLSDGDRRAALGTAAFAARHPVRLAGLVGVLAHRAALRRRSAHWL